jgi:hypothetical protein
MDQKICIAAFDPGVSGGIAWRTPCGGCRAEKMPDTEGGVIRLIESIRLNSSCDTPTAFVEEVGGYIGTKQPGSHMFTFGFNAGLLRGALMATGWRVETVRPAKWQSGLGIGTSKTCKSKPEWKRKLKAEAERRFPKIKVTLSTADALLILDWGLRS